MNWSQWSHCNLVQYMYVGLEYVGLLCMKLSNVIGTTLSHAPYLQCAVLKVPCSAGLLCAIYCVCVCLSATLQVQMCRMKVHQRTCTYYNNLDGEAGSYGWCLVVYASMIVTRPLASFCPGPRKDLVEQSARSSVHDIEDLAVLGSRERLECVCVDSQSQALCCSRSCT